MRSLTTLLVCLFSFGFVFAQNHRSEIKKADSLISITEYDQAEAILNTLANKGTEFEKAITQTSKGFLYLNPILPILPYIIKSS